MPAANTSVNPQLSRMRAAGITVNNRVDVPGWSWGANYQWSFLNGLEDGVAKSPMVDTVYIITDFSAGDNEGNNAEGLSRFLRVLARRHLRLYWSSVRDPVPADYQRIARWSGGGVVHFAP